MAARSVWAQYKIVDHVCRVCFGRILVSDSQARCADCGASGKTVHEVCTCGTLLRTKTNAGLRCVKNPEVSIECPAEIVVSYVGVEKAPKKTVKLKSGGGGVLFGD